MRYKKRVKCLHLCACAQLQNQSTNRTLCPLGLFILFSSCHLPFPLAAGLLRLETLLTLACSPYTTLHHSHPEDGLQMSLCGNSARFLAQIQPVKAKIFPTIVRTQPPFPSPTSAPQAGVGLSATLSLGIRGPSSVANQ